MERTLRAATLSKVPGRVAWSTLANSNLRIAKARLDSTGYETNIHWPTDSSLLWDSYRVMSRLIESVRKLDPEVVDDKRLQAKKAKKLHSKIARRSGKKGVVSKIAKKHYKALIGLVRGIL